MILGITEKTVDSHFHLLEMINKGVNIDDILEIWFNHKCSYLLDIGVDEKNIEKRTIYSTKYELIYHSIGIHPNSATNEIEQRMNLLENQLKLNKKIIAIGETGIDLYWENIPLNLQISYFIKHIELAIKYKLPLIIHDRDASLEIISILNKYKGRISGIIHCFSSNKEILQEYLNLGFYISYSGNITYKKNTETQNSLHYIPLNKILIETDSPYLSPIPLRGKINTPLNIMHTYSYISKKLNIPTDELIKHINTNFEKLFNLERKNDRHI